MKKIIIILLVCILFLGKTSIVTTAENDQSEYVTIDEHSLFSQSAVLIDASSGRVLYGKNPDKQLAMASTTKIMTCITALEFGGLDESVTASAYAAAQPKVKLYMNKGEQYKLEDLLYSLMLESHNDSAVAIAEHIGARLLGLNVDKENVTVRSRDESEAAVNMFVKKMNEKARQLQCYHTWFITPNGLDATEIFGDEEGVELEKTHSTTAYELARIMSYCILQSPQKDAFLKITGTYSYNFTNEEGDRSFICRNHNAFLNMMDGAISGKTGYTGKAGYCYVGALERDGRYYVASLLNTGAYGSGNKNNKWKDMKRLMEYGCQNFHVRILYDGNAITEPVTVLNAGQKASDYFKDKKVHTVIKDNEAVARLSADWEEAEVKIEQNTKVEAPVFAGQKVGTLEVRLNNNIVKQFDIIITEDVLEKSFHNSLLYIVDIFWL